MECVWLCGWISYSRVDEYLAVEWRDILYYCGVCIVMRKEILLVVWRVFRNVEGSLKVMWRDITSNVEGVE